MAEPNRRIVQQRPDGNWEVRKPGSTQPSAIGETQKAMTDRGRDILRNDGGGELQIRSQKGTIRQQDTVPPGNDPKPSKG